MPTLLDQGLVLMHPFVLGELACGSLGQRPVVLRLLADLPHSVVADADEVLVFIDRHRLHGKGLGYVDMHLLASTLLTQKAVLYTRDQRLRAAAQALGCVYVEGGAH